MTATRQTLRSCVLHDRTGTLELPFSAGRWGGISAADGGGPGRAVHLTGAGAALATRPGAFCPPSCSPPARVKWNPLATQAGRGRAACPLRLGLVTSGRSMIRSHEPSGWRRSTCTRTPVLSAERVDVSARSSNRTVGSGSGSRTSPRRRPSTRAVPARARPAPSPRMAYLRRSPARDPRSPRRAGRSWRCIPWFPDTARR